jgi:hypothetical protein
MSSSHALVKRIFIILYSKDILFLYWVFFFAFSHVQMGLVFVVGLSISLRVIALRPTGFG